MGCKKNPLAGQLNLESLFIFVSFLFRVGKSAFCDQPNHSSDQKTALSPRFIAPFWRIVVPQLHVFGPVWRGPILELCSGAVSVRSLVENTRCGVETGLMYAMCFNIMIITEKENKECIRVAGLAATRGLLKGHGRKGKDTANGGLPQSMKMRLPAVGCGHCGCGLVLPPKFFLFLQR